MDDKDNSTGADEAPPPPPDVGDELAALDLLDAKPTRLARVLASSTAADEVKRRLASHALLQAASLGHCDLAEWLLSDEVASRWTDIEARDDDRSPAIVLAAVFGHADMVRLLASRGADINAADARGWTALHWSFQTGNVPLSSFLLNRRASTCQRTHRGLAAADLIRKGSEGEIFREIVNEIPTDAFVESEVSSPHSGTRPKHASLPVTDQERQLTLQMSSCVAARQTNSTSAAIANEGEGLVMAGSSAYSYANAGPDEAHASGSQGSDDAPQRSSAPFDWSECNVADTVAFTLHDLPSLLDVAVGLSTKSSTSATLYVPASIVFLAARFAARFGGEDLLGELLIGAIDRIEAEMHIRLDDISSHAFWLSNSLALLYFLRRDPHTAENTLEYQGNLHDLIRTLVVLCIRDTEMRLDRIIDTALLEHEAVPGFEDVQFEGEWRFVKALTQRSSSKKETPTSLLNGSPSARPSVFGLFGGTPERGLVSSNSVSESIHRTNGGSPHSTPARSRTPSMPVLRGALLASPSPQRNASPRMSSPSDALDILSHSLSILQEYGLAGHPAIIVQAFSQIFYWLASELFNRIMIKKRLMCRSRAIQIRMNVSMIEEWARTNRFPMQMMAAHFGPLNELLQWLQCLSSETTIDGMLHTMQNFKSLNPVQMRRAARDYRHEVNETKMSEECAQYLAQLQKDWENHRMMDALLGQSDNDSFKQSQQLHERPSIVADSDLSYESESSVSSVSTTAREHDGESSHTTDPRSQVERHIDEIFGGTSACDARVYVPPARTDTHAELLNSRINLPFALPTLNEALVRFKRRQFQPDTHNIDITPTQGSPKPISSAVESSTAFNASVEPDDCQYVIPILPDDFLDRLKAARSHYGHTTDFEGLEAEHFYRLPSDWTSAETTWGQEAEGHNYWLGWRERMRREVEAEDPGE